jgi:hypothetical protein
MPCTQKRRQPSATATRNARQISPEAAHCALNFLLLQRSHDLIAHRLTRRCHLCTDALCGIDQMAKRQQHVAGLNRRFFPRQRERLVAMIRPGECQL